MYSSAPAPPPKSGSGTPVVPVRPQQYQNVVPSNQQQSAAPQSPPSYGQVSPDLARPPQQYVRGPPPLPPQVQSQQQIPQPPAQEQMWLPPGLDKHSTADLTSLLSDPELLQAFARQHPAYDASLQPVQQQLDQNERLARQLLELEERVKQQRADTGQLLLRHTSLQTQWRRKQREMDQALEPWGPRAMYQRLIHSIAEQEAIVAAVHDSFFDTDNGAKASEKEVLDWTRQVRESTVVLEKRREMKGRWDEGRVGGWR